MHLASGQMLQAGSLVLPRLEFASTRKFVYVFPDVGQAFQVENR